MSASTESPLGARVSRAELVARALEREIADGLKGGDRLGTKDDLRKRFRVAVATLNEAMRLLEMRGLIEARPGPGGGVFVARPAARIAMSHVVLGFRTGTTSYEECLELRDALEPLVDSHAARYHRARDIRELKRIVRSMEASADDSAAFFGATGRCTVWSRRSMRARVRNSTRRSRHTGRGPHHGSRAGAGRAGACRRACPGSPMGGRTRRRARRDTDDRGD
jgi:DNA-binding IscR family transcriptional regulator